MKPRVTAVTPEARGIIFLLRARLKLFRCFRDRREPRVLLGNSLLYWVDERIQLARLESANFNESELNAFVACGYDKYLAFKLMILGATALHEREAESEDQSDRLQ